MNAVARTPPLADGTLLLHIGPHKTGTTTLQAAFHQNRDVLGRQGVLYVGAKGHSMQAAMAAVGKQSPPTVTPASAQAEWMGLVKEAGDSAARVRVLSSEFLCEADDAAIARILQELGGDRVHVVITLRPLIRIFASQWQQFIQNRMTFSYPDWLDAMLNHAADTQLTPSFWRRHRHDVLVQRWARVAGPERVSVVVVDESDKRMMLTTFEDLVGVGDGTLVPRNAGANRSLTFAEVELLRTFNREYTASGWSHADYTRLVRFGAARYVQQRVPEPDEPGVLTPQWAIDRGVEIGREMAECIAKSGVRVIGDLSSLSDARLATAVGENAEQSDVPAAVAARFVAGVASRVAELPVRPASAQRVPGPLEVAVRRQYAQERLARQLTGTRKLLRAERRRLTGTRTADDLSGLELFGEIARRGWRTLRHRARVRH